MALMAKIWTWATLVGGEWPTTATHALPVGFSVFRFFIFFYKFNCTYPGLQLGDPAPLFVLLLWTCWHFILILNMLILYCYQTTHIPWRLSLSGKSVQTGKTFSKENLCRQIWGRGKSRDPLSASLCVQKNRFSCQNVKSQNVPCMNVLHALAMFHWMLARNQCDRRKCWHTMRYRKTVLTGESFCWTQNLSIVNQASFGH